MARDTQERKQRIIDAAMEEIKETGVEKASMRSIAKRAGITTGSIYHHYKNKEDLLFDVVGDSFHFTTRLSEMDKTGYNDSEEMLSLVKDEMAKRLSKKDEQSLHIQLISDALSKNGDIKKKHADKYRDMINKTADMFYDAYGIDNEVYKQSVASFLVAALDGMAIQSALGVLPEDLKTTTERFNEFFPDSIGTYLNEKLSKGE